MTRERASCGVTLNRPHQIVSQASRCPSLHIQLDPTGQQPPNVILGNLSQPIIIHGAAQIGDYHSDKNTNTHVPAILGVFLLLFSPVRMGTCCTYNMHSFAFGKSRGPGGHFQNDPSERVGEDFAACPLNRT